MRKLLLAAGALVLAAGSAGAVAESALSEQGRGGGQGKGGGHGAHGQGHGNRGGGQQARPQQRGGGQGAEARQRGGGGHGRGPERRAERPERGPGPGRVGRGNGRAERAGPPDIVGRGQGQGRPRAVAEGRPDDRPGNGRGMGGGRGRDEARTRMTERRAVRIDNGREVQRIRWDRGRGLVDGCPPGLARRNNGCLPPGQERQLTRSWYDPWFAYGRGGDPYIYDAGYLYRLRPDGYVVGYAPLLGGALWPGQTWPSAYDAYDVPDYHVDYYGLDDPYDYRFADGVLYGLDPETQAIQAVIALLTGDDWSIGQPMPAGYDIYNVPYDYRDQYADTDDSWYRYSDGYVYQVDPTTRLVEAVIQLVS